MSPITAMIAGGRGKSKGKKSSAKSSGRDNDADDKTPSFKRGGTMKRKGVARLHAGEKIAKRKGRSRGR